MNVSYNWLAQGAALMSKFGVNVPKGVVISSPSEVSEVIKKHFPNNTEVCSKFYGLWIFGNQNEEWSPPIVTLQIYLLISIHVVTVFLIYSAIRREDRVHKF